MHSATQGRGMDSQIEITWRLFQPPEGTWLAWMSRRPEIVGGRLDSLAQMSALAARYGRDSYFTPNPVVGDFGRRPSTVHVAYIAAICIDLDPVAENSTSVRHGEMVGLGDRLHKIERTVIEHAQDILGLELHPDRIDSGRGRQLWLRFEPFPVTTQEEKLRWRTAVGNFLHRLDQSAGIVGNMRVDTSCCDLPRLVRLPGTINTKTGRLAQFLEVGQSDSRVREAILSRFGVAPTPSHSNGNSNSGDWRHNAHWLSGRAKWFIYHGTAEPGRHSAAFAAAASMRELGASHAATERAVLTGAQKCSPPLSEYEAKRCVRNAFAKGDFGA